MWVGFFLSSFECSSVVACLHGLSKALGSVPSITEQANKSMNGEESASSMLGGRITHPETSRTCRPLVCVESAVGQSARGRLKPSGLVGWSCEQVLPPQAPCTFRRAELRGRTSDSLEMEPICSGCKAGAGRGGFLPEPSISEMKIEKQGEGRESPRAQNEPEAGIPAGIRPEVGLTSVLSRVCRPQTRCTESPSPHTP